MSDFFSALRTTEAADRVVRGRAALQSQLAEPTARGGAPNKVTFTGAFEAADGNYDKFTVHVSSGSMVSDADQARFDALGCETLRTDGRVAVLKYMHESYDTRWVKIDMSTPQCWLMAVVVVLALCIAAGALAL